LSCRFQEASVPTKHTQKHTQKEKKRRKTDASLPQRDTKESAIKRICFVMPISRGICTDKAHSKAHSKGKKEERKRRFSVS